MAISFTLNDAVNLDQSSGLQVGADSGSHDDTDVALVSLDGGLTTDVFYDRLVTLTLIPDLFATDVGAASELGSVTVSPSDNGTISGLGFAGALNDNGTPGDPTDDTATPLEVFTGANFGSGGMTGLETVDGEEIRLFRDADAGLGDQLAFGIDENGQTVFAVYMVSNFNLDGTVSVDFHTVTFEPIFHPDNGDPDDEVDLADYLTLSASESITIDFDGTPAGKNLFTMVLADTSDPDGFAIVVTPESEVIALNTSKGGGPTTLALFNQMIDPGEKMVFTFVNNPVDTYTVIPGDPNDLDQNEADLETNILFDNLEYITGGSIVISQTQGPGPHALTLEATAADGIEAIGNGFINGYGDDSTVAITGITILNGTTEIGTWAPGDSGTTIGGVTVTFSHTTDGGIVTVSGFSSGYTIAYDSGPHARLEVSGVLGKFDIGGIGVDQPGSAVGSVGSNVVFDDDGPTANLATTEVNVVLDETDGDGDDDGPGGVLADVTRPIATLFDDTSVFGTDGPKDAHDPEDGTDADATTYSLVLNAPEGTDSGLDDTATGQSIYLYTDGADIVGLVGSAGAADPGGAESFRISLTNDSDEVRVVQSRAVVHDNAADPDESTEPESMNANLVLVKVTVIDDDGDTDSDTAELGARIDFEDDGPQVTAGAVAPRSLVTDDTNTPGDSDTEDLSGAFTVRFGSDGPLGADADTAVSYTLGVKSAGVDSGLDDSLSGDDILLRLNGDVVEGYLENSTGTLAFTISVVETGVNGGDVTLTQLRAIVHNNPLDHVETGAEAEQMAAADLVTLTATATDGDSDPESDTANIALAFAFEDDGPTVTIDEADVMLVLDETVDGDDDDGDGDPLATRSITADTYLSVNTANPGKDGEQSDVWSFQDPGVDASSGLVDTASGQDVVLNLDGGDIVGTTAIGGDEVVRWTIDADDGEVTVTQLRAVVHGNPADPDESTTPETLNADTIVVVRTVKDNDSDEASDTADISGVFKFEDDGPTGVINELDGTVTHDESAGAQNTNPVGADSDAIEDNNDDDQNGALPQAFVALGIALGWAKSASAVVDTTGTEFGSDGEATVDPVVWSLDVPEADTDSGFRDLDGNNILLNKEGDLVVGRVEGSGVVAIALSIDQGGLLSLAQYIPMKHPTALVDEKVIMNDGALLAVLTVTDGDGDKHVVTEPIGDKVIIEDDGPLAGPQDPVNLEEDDLDGVGTELSTGNDNDTTDGNGDESGTRQTATIVLDPGLNIFEGADQPISYNFKDVDPNDVLPALSSRGDAVTYQLLLDETTTNAEDTDVIRAYADGRLVFTVSLVDMGLLGAEVIMTLDDQLDHALEDAPGTENTPLQLSGGGTVPTIDVSAMFDFKDKDGDPVTIQPGFIEYVVADDIPEIAGPTTDPGVVDFLTGLSVSDDLRGSVGTDENDVNNEAQDGTKTYTFTFEADANETITSTSIDGLQALASADGTKIEYFVDGFDGNPEDGAVQAGELFFDVVLGDQGGSGDYTFNVYQGAPPVFTEFDFTDLPSGQNLHGTIAVNKGDLGQGGLLLFPEFVDLDGNGKFTNISQTSNTSKGGGPVTIGNSNQMFDPGEGHYFVYVDNPDPLSVAGLGLNQNNADNAKTVGFDSTIEVSTAAFEIVQVQGNSLAAVTISAFDLDLNTDAVPGEEPVGTGPGEIDPRIFLTDPESFDDGVAVTGVKVYLTSDTTMTSIEEWDSNNGTTLNNSPVVVADNGDGTVSVSGLDDNYTVEFSTAAPHDMALIHAKSGKYDIGGFNLLRVNETPDQLFDYTLDITDFDGDTDSSGFQVLVDGTGIYDDGVFNLNPAGV